MATGRFVDQIGTGTIALGRHTPAHRRRGVSRAAGDRSAVVSDGRQETGMLPLIIFGWHISRCEKTVSAALWNRGQCLSSD